MIVLPEKIYIRNPRFKDEPHNKELMKQKESEEKKDNAESNE